MKKENNSFDLINFVKTVFKPKKGSKKNNSSKREPIWMYRNE